MGIQEFLLITILAAIAGVLLRKGIAWLHQVSG
jgi:hypothetical protein